MMRKSGEIVCVCGGEGSNCKKKRYLYINKMKSDSTSSRVLELKKKKRLTNYYFVFEFFAVVFECVISRGVCWELCLNLVPKVEVWGYC